MSFIQPQAIQAIAHSVDIPRLADDAAAALAPDVEYRLREVVQEALKFAKHSKRQALTTDDVNSALRLRNVQPLYGFGNKDPANFLKAAGHQDLFYVRDRELTLGQLIEAPLPPLPREPGISAHWLFINGQQPAIPENTPLEQPPPAKRAKHEQRAGAATGDGAATSKGTAAHAAATRSLLPHAPDAAVLRSAAGNAAQVQLPVRHLLSKELQVYFDKIVSLVESPEEAAAQLVSPGAAGAPSKAAPKASGEQNQQKQQEECQRQQERQRQQGQELFKAALASLSTDPGLHPLAPYFTAFVANGVAQHIGDLPRLSRLLALARVLLLNPAIHMEHYLQQLMPAVMTCLITKSLGAHASEDHWSIRDQAAAVTALACEQFGEPYHNVAPRVWRMLLKTFLDDSKGFPSKYGAVIGLQALGSRVIRTLLLPHLEPFVTSTLLPAMSGDTGELTRHEAWRVHSVLLGAIGGAMYELLIGMVAERLPEELLVSRAPHPRKFDWDRLETLAAGSDAQAPGKQEEQPDGAAAAVVTGASSQQPGAAAMAGAAAEAQAAKPGTADAKSASEAPAATSQQQQGGAAKQDSTAGPAAHGAGNGTVGAAAAKAGTTNAAAGARDGGAVNGSAAPMDVDRPSEPTAHAKQQQQQQQQQQDAQQANGTNASSRSQGRSSKVADSPADVRAILAESWKEDSDVNAVLGALGALFGEALLAYLPLAELPAFFL